MKKLLLLLIAMMAFACSAPMPDEDAAEVHEALGTCTKPTGGIGDSTYPFDRFISAIGPDVASPWRLMVKSKLLASPFTVSTSYVDFGGVSAVNSQAAIAGPGWVSSSGRKLIELDFYPANATYHAVDSRCPIDTNYTCVFGYEDATPNTIFFLMTFDKRYSSATGPIVLGNGLMAIYGLGDGTQKVAFTGDFGFSVLPKKVKFSGPKLDACLYP